MKYWETVDLPNRSVEFRAQGFCRDRYFTEWSLYGFSLNISFNPKKYFLQVKFYAVYYSTNFPGLNLEGN
jgi:hypothetical protein